jgi:glycosyltransferase involved in cell wall biosynthesis
VTGSTGEDYAQPYTNAIVCDTANPRELAANLELLVEDHDLALEIAAAGEKTAKRYVWPRVLEILARKLKSALPADAASPQPESLAVTTAVSS